MAADSVRPSHRWHEVDRQMPTQLDSGDIGAYLADATEDGKELDRLFDHLEDTTSGKMAKMVRDLRDLACNVSMEAGHLSYDVGYGDGWHAGALATLRAMVKNSGAQVPLPSLGMGVLVGLPYEPVPPLPPARERKSSFISGLCATTEALELRGHPDLATQIVKALIQTAKRQMPDTGAQA